MLNSIHLMPNWTALPQHCPGLRDPYRNADRRRTQALPLTVQVTGS
jgi:hypothetical protein